MAREIFSKNPQAFNLALAEKLKEIPEIQIPEWSKFVKSGASKQRVPESSDFWYIRSASILRQLYLCGVVGVERLRTRYGGRKNRGVRPARFRKSSGKIIRTILQQLEKAGLVETLKERQFGRRLTPKGRNFLDSIDIKETASPALSDFIGKSRELKIEEVQEINYKEEHGIEAQSEK